MLVGSFAELRTEQIVVGDWQAHFPGRTDKMRTATLCALGATLVFWLSLHQVSAATLTIHTPTPKVNVRLPSPKVNVPPPSPNVAGHPAPIGPRDAASGMPTGKRH
jgi:hypothetical protein